MERSRKRFVLGIVAAIAVLVVALAGCSQGQDAEPAGGDTSESAATGVSDVKTAIVTVEGYEPFQIALDPQSAPNTVANFCDLAQQGFYDGLTFYRFVEGFCMQGGSSNNSAAIVDDGLQPIEGEFAQNGVDNPLADDFGRGTVAMARSGDPNSATSTFFVTLDSSEGVSASLNGQYAAFGTIDAAGMDIVDRIVADHLPNVDDPSSGSISDEAQQARIQSIVIQ